MVSDVIHDGKWNLQELRTTLLDEIKSRIIGVPISINSHMIDTLIWSHSKSGNLTVKSTYNMLVVHELVTTVNWSLL